MLAALLFAHGLAAFAEHGSAEASELLAGLEAHEDAARPLAALHLAHGHPELALEVLDRRCS
jgi:hypothetical protein